MLKDTFWRKLKNFLKHNALATYFMKFEYTYFAGLRYGETKS
jgi:hypothetical protein